jgi:single-stranded DNA-binding protein
VNKVELIGDLVSPVEVRRDWSTGRTIAKAIVAVSRGVLGVEFIPVTLWGREATDASAYLGEGSTVAIKGHIHSGFLIDRGAGGSRRRRLVYVIADRVAYLDVRAPRIGGRQ